MPRTRRYHQVQRESDDDQFETEALQGAQGDDPDDDSDAEDVQSESGLGESPEEDLIKNPDSSSDDDDDDNTKDDDDSDSAPEEMSFATTREAEQKRLQTILGQIRQGRETEKQRRRQRDQLFKLQKKEKLELLQKRKLPEDILQELSTTEEKKRKQDTAGDHQDEEEGEVDEESSEKGEQVEEEEDFSPSDDDDDEQDFIPLSVTAEDRSKLKVVSLQADKRKQQPTSWNALEFKQAMLYGKRHRRLTGTQLRLMQDKRRARR